jgi:hypothetical protein
MLPTVIVVQTAYEALVHNIVNDHRGVGNAAFRAFTSRMLRSMILKSGD